MHGVKHDKTIDNRIMKAMEIYFFSTKNNSQYLLIKSSLTFFG